METQNRILTEGILTLKEAAKEVPTGSGWTLNVSTAHRWVKRGIQLEAVRIRDLPVSRLDATVSIGRHQKKTRSGYVARIEIFERRGSRDRATSSTPTIKEEHGQW